MVQNEEQESTFLNQILAQVFDALSDDDNFDKATIVRLRELGKSKELGSFEKVVAALRVDEEA